MQEKTRIIKIKIKDLKFSEMNNIWFFVKSLIDKIFFRRVEATRSSYVSKNVDLFLLREDSKWPYSTYVSWQQWELNVRWHHPNQRNVFPKNGIVLDENIHCVHFHDLQFQLFKWTKQLRWYCDIVLIIWKKTPVKFTSVFSFTLSLLK
jgi:hypothetical protein